MNPVAARELKWSPQQAEALDKAGRWLRSHPEQQVFRLFGYAGTGKTTLARHLAEGAGRVLFGAFTGKAAYVLHESGCPGATTLHRLVYVPKEKSRARLRELEEKVAELARQGDAEAELREARRELEEERKNVRRPSFTINRESPLREADLLVVDEVSMVDERMGADILSFGCKVLVLGDPAQLPPVYGTGYFTAAKPDVLLTEVHRQAAGNPILELATLVRNGQPLKEGEYGCSRVIDWGDVEPEDAQAVDQIIVGTNKLRGATNRRMRQLRGCGSPLPEPGDRLVCLRNDHEVGLLNGSIWHAECCEVLDQDKLELRLRADGSEEVSEVTAHAAYFLGNELPWWSLKEAQEFDYAYALTAHKSQGSQFSKVLVFDQSRAFRDNRHRWLYTAITRAVESVTVVLGG